MNSWLKSSPINPTSFFVEAVTCCSTSLQGMGVGEVMHSTMKNKTLNGINGI